ncbi:MAG: DUF4190 domain-containing protein [Planctomycetota bacterium]
MNDQPAPAPNVTHVHVEKSPSNGMGTAGFVLSLVGWVTCGVLCPVGLVLSIIGVRREPRGLAIAGIIIGALGSLFLLVIGLGVIAGILGLGAASTVIVASAQQAAVQFKATAEVQGYYAQQGSLPDPSTFRSLDPDFTQDTIRYETLTTDSFRLTTPGFDGVFGTDDDTVNENTVTKSGSAPTP